jgi:hypothetical protein
MTFLAACKSGHARDVVSAHRATFHGDVPGNPPVYWSILPDRDHTNGGTGSVYRDAMDRVRGAILDSVASGGNNKRGVNDTSMNPADRNHPDTDAMSQEAANQWWLALAGQSYGETWHQCPTITAAQFKECPEYHGARHDRPVDEQRGEQRGKWILGLDGSTPITVTGQTVLDSTHVQVTVNSHSYSGTPTLKFASAG